MSSPYLGRDLPRRPLGEDGCWRRMPARPARAPGVLLLRRLGPRRAEGVAVAMFGLSLVWACSSADVRTMTEPVILLLEYRLLYIDRHGDMAINSP